MKLIVLPVLTLVASLGASETNIEYFRRLSAMRGLSRAQSVAHRIQEATSSSARHLSELRELVHEAMKNTTDDHTNVTKNATNNTTGPITYRSFNVSHLPREFDWRSPANYAKYGQVVTPVKKQLDCGGCWAFSAIESLESVYAIRTGRLEDLSPAMVIDCAPNPMQCGGDGGCGGSTSELAFEYLQAAGGAVSEFSYGYTKDGNGIFNKTSGEVDSVPFDNGKNCLLAANTEKSDLAVVPVAGYRRIESNNATAVMQALMEHGPLSVSVDASNWGTYTGGILDCNSPKWETNNYVDLNHGVVLVGWGEEDGTPYWSIRNSWGTQFGEKGYIRLKRNAPEKVPCYVDKAPLDGVACKGVSPSVMAKVIANETTCGACGVLFDVSVPLLPETLHLRQDGVNGTISV